MCPVFGIVSSASRDSATVHLCSESLPNSRFVLNWASLSIISIQISIDQWLQGWIQARIRIHKILTPCSASILAPGLMTFKKQETGSLLPVVMMQSPALELRLLTTPF